MGASSSRRGSTASTTSEDAAAATALQPSSATDEDETSSEMSATGMLASYGLAKGYEDLVNAVIRPPRMSYDPETDLGPATFTHCGRRFKRQDLDLKNGRGHKLACSWWKFEPEDAPAPQLPCVIYLHGNASCRLAAFELLRHLLPAAITVFALDFSGSGLSEGDYVSLGYYEREDVEAVIAHLRASGEVSTVGLWGHSMGATTALLYGDRDPSIAGMVLDSSFTDLMQLINELGQNLREQGLRIPGFAISVAAGMIRRSVRKRAKFDPRDVSPSSKCGQSFIPALFAHGEKDTFIRPEHSQQLCAAYAGDKNLVLFDGDHNSQRPDFLFDSAVIFLRQTLGVKDEHALDRESPSEGRRSRVFDRGVHADAAQAVRRTEDEMMRKAMMLSMTQTAGGSSQAADAEAPAAVAAAAPPPPDLRLTEAKMREGIHLFQGVTGVGGKAAQYYVQEALGSGGSVQDAIAQYFDCDCLEPPASWRPLHPDLATA